MEVSFADFAQRKPILLYFAFMEAPLRAVDLCWSWVVSKEPPLIDFSCPLVGPLGFNLGDFL